MRYFTIVLFLIIGFQFNIKAQDESAKDMMEADEFIEEEIEGVEWLTQKFLDLGELYQGEPKSVEYQFKNNLDEPIFIIEVKSSCSCSVSEYTKTPILKGEIGTIIATYDAKAEGEFFKTFMLLTSRSKTPNVLVISGKVLVK